MLGLDFRAEVERQAAELYGSRRNLEADTDKLLRGGAPGHLPSRDLPDFCTRMLDHLDPCGVTVVGGSPRFAELADLLGHGSTATSLDELPKGVLQHMGGAGVHAACHYLRALHDGAESKLLNAVLHLPLKKRDPPWLLKNSRPVLLEPYLRRLEATCVFRRQQRRLEGRGALPSCMFAYRRQLRPQHAALLGRWLIAAWAAPGSPVLLADWDEVDAFCNVPHTACGVLAGEDCPGLDDWLTEFYPGLDVYVVSRHPLTGNASMHRNSLLQEIMNGMLQQRTAMPTECTRAWSNWVAT